MGATQLWCAQGDAAFRLLLEGDTAPETTYHDYDAYVQNSSGKETVHSEVLLVVQGNRKIIFKWMVY